LSHEVGGYPPFAESHATHGLGNQFVDFSLDLTRKLSKNGRVGPTSYEGTPRDVVHGLKVANERVADERTQPQRRRHRSKGPKLFEIVSPPGENFVPGWSALQPPLGVGCAPQCSIAFVEFRHVFNSTK
jgi:hypothetical protein